MSTMLLMPSPDATLALVVTSAPQAQRMPTHSLAPQATMQALRATLPAHSAQLDPLVPSLPKHQFLVL